ncbi:MAG TPA: M48 family metalloprotease, partial [Candidatus Obscuribacterales bacterium]
AALPPPPGTPAAPPPEREATTPPPPEVAAAPPPEVDAPNLAAIPPASLFHYERLNEGHPAPTPDAAPDPDAASGADVAPPDVTPPPEVAPAEVMQFAHGGRLAQLRRLPQPGQAVLQLWVMQGLSAIALFWLSRAFIHQGLAQIANFLSLFSGIVPLPLAWRDHDHTLLTLMVLAGLLLASPWLLDWLLQATANQQSLTLQKLKQTHPEGCRLLRRITQQRQWLLPHLRLLPTDAPLIFSYGWLPRYSRLVVSRGLLNQLDDAELATVMGYELTHLTTGTQPYMSLVGLLLQGLHQGYWQTAQWGDRQRGQFTKTLAAAVAACCYGLYWLVRKVHVPLARSRVLGGDRQTVEWTGNPNALTRALIKLEHGIAQTITQTGYTVPLLESTDLLTPSSYEAAISLGSLFPDLAFLKALQWDVQNPYRHWLSLNSSHPPLGERLQRLTGYALRWQLTPEIPFPLTVPNQQQRRTAFWDGWVPFIQQISPDMGPLVGVAIAMLLWFLGGIFEPLGLRRVAWVYGDRSVLWGSLLLGLGMGIMVRINPYFPDITVTNRRPNPALATLLTPPLALPTDSQPIHLEGTLLGRRGMANWLCQDLILKTSTGLVKLHFLSILGALGNLLHHPQHPTDWVGRAVAVQGWYRRGAIAWVDVDAFTQADKTLVKANHPLWSVILSLTFCAWGLVTLIRG